MIDLTGETYGELKVIKKDSKDKWNRWQWLCKCSCGNMVVVGSNQLRTGNTKSCGCRKHVRDNKIEDITGKRYGGLTVLYLDPNRSSTGKTKWVCECDCGNVISVFKTHLVTGHTTSCRKKGMHITDTRRKREIWAEKVKNKFNHVCKKCGISSDERTLHAHHVLSFTTYEDLRFDVDNGVCLCEYCHKEFHKKYGKMRNTKEDFYEWLNDRKEK